MGKILVVDDQFGLRRMLLETFREDKHEVETAANGTEALQLFISFKPDLILMDMKMPGMNGIETLRQISILDHHAPVTPVTPVTPVIMMTAYGDNQNMEQAKELGIVHYMSKPFDLFELRDRVSKILNS